MICVGGPAAGKSVQMSDFYSRFRYPEPPTHTDIAYSFRNSTAIPKPIEIRIHEYRPEHVLFEWYQCGRFECYALVHESVTEKAQIESAVLSAFMGDMLASAARGKIGGAK